MSSTRPATGDRPARPSPSLHPQEAVLAEQMGRALKGDSQAYRELLMGVRMILERYVSSAFGRMGMRSSEAVEDVVQEALLAIHAKRHTYDPTQLFTPWLFAITRYKLIDFARKVKKQSTSVDWSEVEDELLAPNQQDPAAASDLEVLMEALPEKQRRAVELVKLEGLTLEEASSRTLMSVPALKVSIHRAMKSLRARIQKGEKAP